MTAASRSLATVAMKGALRDRLAVEVLHHRPGHDQGPISERPCYRPPKAQCATS